MRKKILLVSMILVLTILVGFNVSTVQAGVNNGSIEQSSLKWGFTNFSSFFSEYNSLKKIVANQQKEIEALKEITKRQSQDIQTLKAIVSELKYATCNSTPFDYEETVTGVVVSNFGDSLGDGIELQDGSKYYLRRDCTDLPGLQNLPPNHTSVKLYLDANSRIVGWEIIH